MLVDVLADDRCVHRGGVRLVTDSLLVLELTLAAVAGSVVFVDVLLDVAGDLRGDVLVVAVDFRSSVCAKFRPSRRDLRVHLL